MLLRVSASSTAGGYFNEPQAFYVCSTPLLFLSLLYLAFQFSAIIYEAMLFHACLIFHRSVAFACLPFPSADKVSLVSAGR